MPPDIQPVPPRPVQLVEDLAGPLHIFRLALQAHPALAGGHLDLKRVLQVFQQAQVVRVERLQSPRIFEIQGLESQRSCWDDDMQVKKALGRAALSRRSLPQ